MKYHDMAVGYLETALMLKRSIAKLREKRAKANRLCDKADFDRRIEALECNYYDNMAHVEMFRDSLTAEELEQARQANLEMMAPYIERAERKRNQNRACHERRTKKKKEMRQ